MSNHDPSPSADGGTDQRSANSADWQSFCHRLDQGDSRAMRELFEKYSKQLIQLAGRNIHPALARRFDGEDVVQSVFRTFFRRQQEGEFRIEHSQQLWKLLVTITICKTRSQARRHTAECRDVQGEQISTSDRQFLDRQASPEDVLAFWEEIDAAIQGLPDRTAEIISCRLEGKNKTEIAQQLNLSRQTIHRILKLVEERLIQRFQYLSADDQLG